MKKTGILFCLLATVSLSLNSCKNAEENKSEMKTPVDAMAAAEKSAMPTMTTAEAKVKTIADLQEAFNGESNATARYAAFSKKAAEEAMQNRTSDIDFAHAQSEFAMAAAQLAAIAKLRQKR